MGGGGTRVEYKAPKPDNSFAKFLEYQIKKEAADTKRAEDEKKAEAAAAEAKRQAGVQGFGAYKSNVYNQLQKGLISFGEAEQKLSDYGTKYGMVGTDKAAANLGNRYLEKILPGQRNTAILSAYEEILGRAPTKEELAKSTERYAQGYYSNNNDLRDALYKSTEYQDKYNQSYLDNYYDTKFGKQTVDKKGKKTGKRTFKFSSNLLPAFKEGAAADLVNRTGIKMPDFGESFTGTSGEIEEQLQNIRDSRQFLYSAGLTNLQGEIDKETQKLKNEGQKEIAKIGRDSSIYSSLVSGFWS